jgi:Bacterial SH3 domain
MLSFRNILFILLLSIGLITKAQGQGELVKVKIQSGQLNVRKEPSKDAAIVGKIPMDEYVHFQMEHENGWIKVKYVYLKSGDLMESMVGWVHRDFVECPMLKSRFLDCAAEADNYGITALESAYGYVMQLGQDNQAFIVVAGKEITLNSTDESPNVYKGNGFVIEPVLFNTDSGYESAIYTGFLRIQKGTETEYVFVTGSFVL